MSWADCDPTDRELHELLGDTYSLEDALKLRGYYDKASAHKATTAAIHARDDAAAANDAAKRARQRDRAAAVRREVAAEVCGAVALPDEKRELVADVVARLGAHETRGLLRKALDRERSGGVARADGRRRSPAGAFLALVKERVSADAWRDLCAADDRRRRRVAEGRRETRDAAPARSDGLVVPSGDVVVETPSGANADDPDLLLRKRPRPMEE